MFVAGVLCDGNSDNNPVPVSLLVANAHGCDAYLEDTKSTADVRLMHAMYDSVAIYVLLNDNKAICIADFTGYATLRLKVRI